MYKTILKEGPGTPLVFLHGFLGRSEDWKAVCSYLPPCQCVGYDLPGHGRSPFEPRVTIDLPEFHLIGYSMGARIAMNMHALSHTLLSVHPGLKTEEEKAVRLKSDAEWARLLLSLPIDEFLQRWYNQMIFKPFIPDLKMRRDQNVEGLAKAMMHFSLAHQTYREIEAAIVGEHDAKFRQLHKSPIIIPNASHMVHLENPKAVAEIIKERVNL